MVVHCPWACRVFQFAAESGSRCLKILQWISYNKTANVQPVDSKIMKCVIVKDHLEAVKWLHRAKHRVPCGVVCRFAVVVEKANSLERESVEGRPGQADNGEVDSGPRSCITAPVPKGANLG